MMRAVGCNLNMLLKYNVQEYCLRPLFGRTTMGKYFLAWILGVPAFVLVIIYFLMN